MVTSPLTQTTPELSLSRILEAPENRALLRSLDQFATALTRYGIHVSTVSKKSVQKLAEVSQDKKEMIAASFDQARHWLVPPSAATAGELHVSAEVERECAHQALDFFGLKAHDDFWKTFGDDQIVEIYGIDMIQLYRGLNFYKYCGYSLLDISVFEWYVLWERPRKVIEQMAAQTNHVLDNCIPVFKFNLPKHVLRETYNTGLTDFFTPRACMAEFLHIGALQRHPAGPAQGFICTARGELIAEGSEALNIEFV